MSGFITEGSMSTGHDGYPPTVALAGSGDVFVNGKSVHRLGDGWAPHCRSSCHSGTTTPPGDRTVLINGLPVGMVGDPISCGDTAATGSPDVSG